MGLRHQNGGFGRLFSSPACYSITDGISFRRSNLARRTVGAFIQRAHRFLRDSSKILVPLASNNRFARHGTSDKFVYRGSESERRGEGGNRDGDHNLSGATADRNGDRSFIYLKLT